MKVVPGTCTIVRTGVHGCSHPLSDDAGGPSDHGCFVRASTPKARGLYAFDAVRDVEHSVGEGCEHAANVDNNATTYQSSSFISIIFAVRKVLGNESPSSARAYHATIRCGNCRRSWSVANLNCGRCQRTPKSPQRPSSSSAARLKLPHPHQGRHHLYFPLHTFVLTIHSSYPT